MARGGKGVAHYKEMVADLDKTVEGTPFAELASWVSKEKLNAFEDSLGLTFPAVLPKAGVYTRLNEDVGDLGQPVGHVKGVYYLFFVTFDICEENNGCLLYVHEMGSSFSHDPNQGKNESFRMKRDVLDKTKKPDVKKVKLAKKNGVCDERFIYVDAPGNFGYIKGDTISFDLKLVQKVDVWVTGPPAGSVDKKLTLNHKVNISLAKDGTVKTTP